MTTPALQRGVPSKQGVVPAKIAFVDRILTREKMVRLV
jgi:hypothetical protein